MFQVCVCVCDWISMLCWSRSYGIDMYEFRNLYKFIHKFGTTCILRWLALWVKLWDWTKSWEQLTVDPQLLTKVKPVMWNDVMVWTFLCWCHMMLLYQLSNRLPTADNHHLGGHSLLPFFEVFLLAFQCVLKCWRLNVAQPKVVRPGMWSNSSHSSSHIAVQHCRKLNWAPFISPWTDWDFPCDSFPIVFIQPSMSSQEISVVMPSACMSLASTQGSDLTPRLSKGCAPLTQPHPARHGLSTWALFMHNIHGRNMFGHGSFVNEKTTHSQSQSIQNHHHFIGNTLLSSPSRLFPRAKSAHGLADVCP